MLLLIIFIILLGSEVLFENRNNIKLNLKKNGTVTFVRVGKIVYVEAKATCEKDSALILNSNDAEIPDWAIPAEAILTPNSSGTILEGEITSDMNGRCRGRLLINMNADKSFKRVSTVMLNTDTLNNIEIKMILIYPVD